MERLSTGSRINGAKMMPSSHSSRGTSQIRGLDMEFATRMMQSACCKPDGALIEVTNKARMRELAVRPNGTTTEDDRNYFNAEYNSIRNGAYRTEYAMERKSTLQGDADAVGDSTCLTSWC